MSESLLSSLLNYLLEKHPEQLFAFLRKFAPFFTMKVNGKTETWVSRAADVREILSQFSTFNVVYRPAMDPATGPFMLARDNEPLHDHEKAIMRSVLLKEDIPQIRKMASQFAKANIETALLAQGSDGQINVVSELGRKVAIQIVQSYFGFQGPDEESMLKWSRATQASFFNNTERDPTVTKVGTENGVEMRNYIRSVLIPKRKEELKSDPNKQDALSRLLRTKFVEEANFDEERIVSNTMGFIVGGVETINNAVCKALDRLFEMPQAMDMAREAAEADDDEKLTKICWEALRFNVPPFLPRLVSKDTYVNGHLFKQGTIVKVSQRSAFFDPTFVEKPHEFNPNRQLHLTPSFHFGHGIHKCLGQHVATAVMPMIMKQVLLHKPLVKRVEGIRGQLTLEDKFVENFWIEWENEKAPVVTNKPSNKLRSLLKLAVVGGALGVLTKSLLKKD